MATIVWALLGLAAICGTSWGYPVGVTTLNTSPETRVSDSSSSSEEELGTLLEAKLTVTAEVGEGAEEDTKDHTSHEEVQPTAEENEERGVEHDGGGSVTSSSSGSSTEEVVEGGERTHSGVQDS